MKALKEIMSTNVEIISPDATIRDAAKKMDDLDVGALPVCESDLLLGIVTDRDIIIRSISAGHDPNIALVRDAMTSPIHYCYEDQSIEDAAKLMENKQIRRIAVLNRNKRLVGIVSLGDLAIELQDRELTAEVTEKVSQSIRPAA